MFQKMITLGDKLTIIQMAKDNKEGEKEYVSKVLDVKGEDELHIGVPLERLNEMPLITGNEYKICIYTKRGLVNCTGRVIESYNEGDLKIIAIKLAEEVKRQQRRQYYRLSMTMQVRYREYDEEASAEEERLSKWKRATLTDISGGGARFSCKEKLEEGSTILIRIRFQSSMLMQPEELIATVISSVPMENADGDYEIRAEFSKDDVIQREKIIKYIFEEERKQLRQEKGLV